MFAIEEKRKILQHFIEARIEEEKFYSAIADAFGCGWSEESPYDSMIYHYEAILESILQDEPYNDYEWLYEFVIDWAYKEANSQPHQNYCYDQEAGFPIYDISTIDKCIDCILDMPFICFKGDKCMEEVDDEGSK